MITGPVRYLILGALLAALLALGGCAYTVTTVEAEPPKPGPPVQTGQAAVMDQVNDLRSWPGEVPDSRIAHVRVFAPQMTDLLRQELVQRGLFTALPEPAEDPALKKKAELEVVINSFALEETGKNPWLVPHILLDGVALPVFTVVAVGTGGEIDLGGYAFPSMAMATNLRATVKWMEPWQEEAILNRDYIVTLPLGAVSERELKQKLGDYRSYGVSLGQEAGVKAVTDLADQMSRDPYWAYLRDYQRLARAEYLLKLYNQGPPPSLGLPSATVNEWPTPYRGYSARSEVKVNTFRDVRPVIKTPGTAAAQSSEPTPSLGQMVEQVKALLDIVKPLAYAPDEVGVLTDGYLEAEQRAAIVNTIRAQRLGLEGPKDLPPEALVSEEAAKELYDAPVVYRSKVQAELVERVFALAVSVLTPKTDVPSAQTQALRQGLINQIAAKVKDQPNLQVLLLAKAETAVNEAWPPMQELLKLVGSPMTQRYLARRAG
ncbi:hypothetical protein AAU61_16740 [Desulfocarbo indianensis]|nr:hypothetical protein AAU61_16740 [Desulfocarbo indianensis]